MKPPDIPDDAPLQVRRKRTITDAGSEATGAQTKKSKKDTSEASNLDNNSAPIPKRKRRKGESSSIKNAASEADTQDRFAEAKEERAKKMKAFKEQYESPMFVMTLEMAKHANEKAKKMIVDKKQQKAEYLVARDERLKELGLDNCDEYFVQKIAEVRQMAGSMEQESVEKAKEMLEKIPEISEAALESATVAAASEASPKVTQTSDLPFIIPTHISLISVNKELNRLYILGTLITWFASYPAKSSQILKNHSIMLFTSNANTL